MESQKLYKLVLKKSNWIAHIIYWLIAACLLFFIFSNRDYDYNIRLILVGFLILTSYVITHFINYFLIPRHLFTGKLWIFIYLILGIFITILWLILYLSILLVIYNTYNLPNIMVPQKEDIIILVSGNYLIIIFAAFIHFVKESYRKLIEKSEVEKQRKQTELKLKEANLKLLQGQIHPHFLFNMLNNLYGLIKGDVNSSREIIVKLSGLLDYMLYECDKPFVRLDKELVFIKNYIELERIRHDEDFSVEVQFQELSENYLIAPLILFPFVENAFKHGFHNPSKNYIFMELKIRDNTLLFDIRNKITSKKADKYLNQEGKGIGIKNIKERLELIYKGRYQLDIIEKNSEYQVKLRIDLTNGSE